jgi:hypothetical protein
MPGIMFRCGYRVQGWIAEDTSAADENTYKSLACVACHQMHLVNSKTGQVMGGSEEG